MKTAVDHVIDLLLADPSAWGWKYEDGYHRYTHKSGIGLLMKDAKMGAAGEPIGLYPTAQRLSWLDKRGLMKALRRHDSMKFGLKVASALDERNAA